MTLIHDTPRDKKVSKVSVAQRRDLIVVPSRELPIVTIYRNGLVNLNRCALRVVQVNNHQRIDLMPPGRVRDHWKLDRRSTACFRMLEHGVRAMCRFITPLRVQPLFAEVDASVKKRLFHIQPDQDNAEIFVMTEVLTLEQ